MASLEPVSIATSLKRYPYFMDWLKELYREPEEVKEFCIQGNVREVPSMDDFKRFEPTGTYTVSITFKDGAWFERRHDGSLTCIDVAEEPE